MCIRDRSTWGKQFEIRTTKMRTAFLLCLIVVGAIADIQLPTAFGPRKPKMVLTEIMNQIQAGGPIHDVWDVLDLVEDDINNEQAEHDSLWASVQIRCEDEIDFRNHEIGDATDAYNRATEHYNQCDASLGKNRADLQINLDSQTSNVQRSRLIEETRTSQHEDYLNRLQAARDGQDAVAEALEIIDQLTGGSEEFVQLAAVSKKMLAHAIKLKRTHVYAAPVAALAQMATNQDLFGNEAAIQRVIELLNRLEENIQEFINETEEGENANVALYNDLKESQVAELEDLQHSEARLRNNIGDFELCVAVENSIRAKAQSKRDRNQQLLNDITALCNTWESEHNYATAARKDMLETIAALRRLLKARLGKLNQPTLDADNDFPKTLDSWEAINVPLDQAEQEAADQETTPATDLDNTERKRKRRRQRRRRNYIAQLGAFQMPTQEYDCCTVCAYVHQIPLQQAIRRI
eukprot:TRINITY_DN10_c0_g1_i2.p2 TRINITY_DN10_c0_g1~~TRINITY_DN10_c0_g1_i2.p2  ORF type:complete len:498 (-),score=253.11 TRINITY_DN10_c0_g1_i2:101-1495(-)